MHRLLHTIGIVILSAVMLAQVSLSSFAQQRGNSPRLIRDAEIEELMGRYLKPIFKAAGIPRGAVKIYLIDNSRINAFVAGGQRIFIHTGLIEQASTPNEVIGVLAHETAHVAEGHLARLGVQLDRASTQIIIGTLLGAAAAVGASQAGVASSGGAAGALVFSGTEFAKRNLLSYVRAQEAAADEGALRYLNASGQSGRGMLELFQRLYNQSIASVQYIDPYAVSHPLPLQRIRILEDRVRASKHYNKKDKDYLVFRHKMAQAKLAGFTRTAQSVNSSYPASDQSIPAQYARAIAAYRVGDLKTAIPAIDKLIAQIPKNPYFWELKGQALLEKGFPAKAVAPLQQALKLYPKSGLISILLAQALLAANTKEAARTALSVLSKAQRFEGESGSLHLFKARAHGILGDYARAELSTAESAMLRGDKKLAKRKAEGAKRRAKSGSTVWIRATDILNSLKKNKS
ncbi:MAG: M48 family metalloprotease [Anderseniella sp.]